LLLRLVDVVINVEVNQILRSFAIFVAHTER
jgi:hypothetical protein